MQTLARAMDMDTTSFGHAPDPSGQRRDEPPQIVVPLDWRRPQDRRQWRIVFDPRHRFGQVQPRPTAEDIGGFYDIDAYYTHAEKGRFDEAREARQVGLTGRVLGALAYRRERGIEPTPDWWRSVIPPAAANALEIGCGDGDRMRTYAPLVGHVRGVEPDTRAVRVARDDRGLDVHAGTAERLPDAVKDRSYGLIVFWHVLEHTLDPVAALRNAAALLDEEGVMAIEVPNNGCAGARMMRECWRWLDAPRHLNFFTADSLRACAEAAGLRVEATQYRGYVRQFMPDWITDEATIAARMRGREPTQRDVNRQLRHSVRLLARTAWARPEHKYDSVRILCRRA